MSSGESSPASPSNRRLDAAARDLLRSCEDGARGADEREGAGEGDAADRAVRRAWDAFGEIGSTPEVLALRRSALGEAVRVQQGGWRQLRAKAGARRIGVVAAVVAVLALAGAYVTTGGPQPQTFETHVGERRTVALPDGSKLALDEDSRVTVAYSGRFRDLQLVKGQAEFEVATDPLRPFSVLAGGRRVIATGTLLNVELLDRQLLVTPLRGSAVVGEDAAEPGRARAIALKPSERLTVEQSTGSTRTAIVDAPAVEAWKVGKLVFQSEPLDRAVARVNRYSRRQIAIEEWEHARAPVNGVFAAGDIDGFATAVTAQLPVRAEARGAGLAFVPREAPGRR